MNKYRAEAKYKRVNPKTKQAEDTSRFHEGYFTNKGACEAVLMSHVKLDEVVGKVSVTVKKVA